MKREKHQSLSSNSGFGSGPLKSVLWGLCTGLVVLLGILLGEAAAAGANFPKTFAGDYEGLLLPVAGAEASRAGYGFGTLKVTTTGSFTGTVQISGKSFPISGMFDGEGRASFGTKKEPRMVLSRFDQPDLFLGLGVDVGGGSGITGDLSEAGPGGAVARSSGILGRVHFDGSTPAKTLPTSAFAVAIPSAPQSSGLKRGDFPRGAGIGGFSYVTKGGIGTLTLMLPDGTPAVAKCRFNEAKEAPFFVPLYNGGGHILGKLVWDEGAKDSDLRCDSVRWFKPQLNDHYYPMGWPEGLILPLIGTRLQSVVQGSIFPDLSAESSPNLSLQFSSGGLSKPLKEGVTLSQKDVAPMVLIPGGSLQFSVDRSTGLIKGEGDLYDGAKAQFSGVVLNKGANRRALGFFLSPKVSVAAGTGKSGSFSAIAEGNANASIVISEFMADNRSTRQDETGNYSDWLEIYNPGDAAVNLAGWYLSDDAEDLKKWKFPAVELGAKRFLIVWASGKNRVDPSGALHTNFSLSAGGEYLALVRPDGETVEFQYAANKAGLEADESFGLDFGGRSLVGRGKPGRVWFGSVEPPAGWNQPAFVDTGWRETKGGLGFGEKVPGFLVRQVVPSDSFSLGKLANVGTLLALPKGDARVNREKTMVFPQFNFLGDGSEGHYPGNLPLPIEGANRYVLEAKGYFYVPEDGVYTFGLNSDDGGAITVDGKKVVTDDTLHGPLDHLSAPLNLTKGWHAIEAVMWEEGGGDEVELFAAKGAFDSWNAAFELMGSDTGLAVRCTPQASDAG